MGLPCMIYTFCYLIQFKINHDFLIIYKVIFGFQSFKLFIYIFVSCQYVSSPPSYMPINKYMQTKKHIWL